MADKITVPTDNKPTPPERKGWMWAFWATLSAPLIWFSYNILTNQLVSAVQRRSQNPNRLLGFLPNIVAVLATFGTIVGGYFTGIRKGNKQAEEEIKSGTKTIKPPSFFNSNMAKTAVISTSVTFAGFWGFTYLSNLGVMPNLTGIAAGLTLFGGLATSAIASIVSGFKGRKQRKEEYEAAKEMANSISQGRGISQQQDMGTAPEMAGLATSRVQPRGANYASAENLRRAQPGTPGMQV